MQILFRNLCKKFTCVECFTNSRFCSHLTDKLHLYACVCAQSRPSLCNPMGCSPPGSSVHGISQAGILEQFASFSSSYISMWAIKRHLNICYYASRVPHWSELLYFSCKKVYIIAIKKSIQSDWKSVLHWGIDL